mmetsp:Transcript_4169/g.9017  ORF Transcript_4169/g.9017 Transcript_4169/m.9017 type:complete len:215 (-) Transcript_4169:1369-2013(-)
MISFASVSARVNGAPTSPQKLLRVSVGEGLEGMKSCVLGMHALAESTRQFRGGEGLRRRLRPHSRSHTVACRCTESRARRWCIEVGPSSGVMPLLGRRGRRRRRSRSGGIGLVERGSFADWARGRHVRFKPLDDARLVKIVLARQLERSLLAAHVLEADDARLLCASLGARELPRRQLLDQPRVGLQRALVGARRFVELQQHLVVRFSEIAIHE